MRIRERERPRERQTLLQKVVQKGSIRMSKKKEARVVMGGNDWESAQQQWQIGRLDGHFVERLERKK